MTDNKALNAKLDFLNQWASNVNKDFDKGKGSLLVLDPENPPKIEYLPSGSPALDVLLGGGWPRGAWAEIFGPESSGKSTLAYSAIAELHKRNPESVAVLLDAENSYDVARGERMGIDRKRLVHMSVQKGAEGAFTALRDLINDGPRMADGKSFIDLVVVDSVTALVPTAEFEGGVEDLQVGAQARLMSKVSRMLFNVASPAGVTILWINQVREKIGVMYGNPETTPGGRALKFYTHVRVRTGASPIKAGDEIIAQTTRIKVDKNKTSGRKTTIEVVITPKYGLDFGQSVYAMGQKVGVVEALPGAFFVANAPEAGEIKIKGKDNFIKAINGLSQSDKQALYDAIVAEGTKPEVDIDDEPEVDPQVAGVTADADEDEAAA